MSLEAAAVTIRGLLFADVFAHLLQLKAHCGHCVSTGPEVLAREIPLFATQAGHRYGALPYDTYSPNWNALTFDTFPT